MANATHCGCRPSSYGSCDLSEPYWCWEDNTVNKVDTTSSTEWEWYCKWEDDTGNWAYCHKGCPEGKTLKWNSTHNGECVDSNNPIRVRFKVVNNGSIFRFTSVEFDEFPSCRRPQNTASDINEELDHGDTYLWDYYTCDYFNTNQNYRVKLMGRPDYYNSAVTEYADAEFSLNDWDNTITITIGPSCTPKTCSDYDGYSSAIEWYCVNTRSLSDGCWWTLTCYKNWCGANWFEWYACVTPSEVNTACVDAGDLRDVQEMQDWYRCISCNNVIKCPARWACPATKAWEQCKAYSIDSPVCPTSCSLKTYTCRSDWTWNIDPIWTSASCTPQPTWSCDTTMYPLTSTGVAHATSYSTCPSYIVVNKNCVKQERYRVTDGDSGWMPSSDGKTCVRNAWVWGSSDVGEQNFAAFNVDEGTIIRYYGDSYWYCKRDIFDDDTRHYPTIDDICQKYLWSISLNNWNDCWIYEGCTRQGSAYVCSNTRSLWCIWHE